MWGGETLGWLSGIFFALFSSDSLVSRTPLNLFILFVYISSFLAASNALQGFQLNVPIFSSKKRATSKSNGPALNQHLLSAGLAAR